MKRLIAILFCALPLLADEKAAVVLARSDDFRTPIESFSVDVELTSFAAGGKTDTSRFRVYGRSSARGVVEFTFPQTEKDKYMLMLRDAMWIYIPSASRPI